MIRRIDHTAITVSNLQRSVAFYTGLLGFQYHHEMWIPGSKLRIIFLKLGDTTLELFGVSEIKGSAFSDINEVLGYKHIALLVDSVEDEYQRLAAAGVDFRIKPVDVLDRVRIAFLKHPDGMDIELIEYLDRN